jgi:hypothetical protein
VQGKRKVNIAATTTSRVNVDKDLRAIKSSLQIVCLPLSSPEHESPIAAETRVLERGEL